MNSIGVIAPYKYEGMWVFDDPRVGLIREPFVAGIDCMIDRLVASIPDAQGGFRLLFSSTPFPGYTVELSWRREEYGGNWYYSPQFSMEGWLCPALFKYFDRARLNCTFEQNPRANQRRFDGPWKFTLRSVIDGDFVSAIEDLYILVFLVRPRRVAL